MRKNERHKCIVVLISFIYSGNLFINRDSFLSTGYSFYLKNGYFQEVHSFALENLVYHVWQAISRQNIELAINNATVEKIL
jgi:hypothetical protein